MYSQNPEEKNVNSNLEKTNILLEKYFKSIAWYKVFGRGILAGLGGTVGLAILLWVAFYILNKLKFLPHMENFIQNFKILLQSRPTL